jgi:hypothetical protein
MSPGEVVTRVQDEARRRTWQRRQVHPGEPLPPIPLTIDRKFRTTLPAGTASAVPAAARAALLKSADELMEGRWESLGVERDDLVAPDWFFDPCTGRRAPSAPYTFSIQHRSEAVTGNVKQVWELSRHQHLTLLAAAYFVSGEERYAKRVAQQLTSWWTDNPFLSGVHWTSGIELGLRLIAWTWIRRLLDDWSAAPDLFENNDLAVHQLFWHQEYLAAFRSCGSSANNHVIAEAAGRLVAADAFPWFPESGTWRADAARTLQDELQRNTFPSGVNRELASEYHGFVAELAYTAAIEADAAGAPLDKETWTRIAAMTDAAAALVDTTGRPPRQGDGDDGAVLRVDATPPADGPWASLLALGAAIVGRGAWWPPTKPTVFSTIGGALADARVIPGRPPARRSVFADAGIVLLRTRGADPEIWCRCDSGPHGFLATAAHGHADALSIEVRYDGVDVLADPGTYCYHGEPEWRSYYRSTAAHNTVEIARQNQSRADGPFLWGRTARTQLLAIEHDSSGQPCAWTAEHDGYEVLTPPARHRRSVDLDPAQRALTIRDQIATHGTYALRVHFHLGPAVTVELDGTRAQLRWPTATGEATAAIDLPPSLRWSVHCGEVNPILGWYSPGFGEKVPTAVLRGVGVARDHDVELVTRLEFDV